MPDEQWGQILLINNLRCISELAFCHETFHYSAGDGAKLIFTGVDMQSISSDDREDNNKVLL